MAGISMKDIMRGKGINTGLKTLLSKSSSYSLKLDPTMNEENIED